MLKKADLVEDGPITLDDAPDGGQMLHHLLLHLIHLPEVHLLELDLLVDGEEVHVGLLTRVQEHQGRALQVRKVRGTRNKIQYSDKKSFH